MPPTTVPNAIAVAASPRAYTSVSSMFAIRVTVVELDLEAIAALATEVYAARLGWSCATRSPVPTMPWPYSAVLDAIPASG